MERARLSVRGAPNAARADDVALAVNSPSCGARTSFTSIWMSFSADETDASAFVPELPEDGWVRIRGPRLQTRCTARDCGGVELISESRRRQSFPACRRNTSNDAESRSGLMIAVAGVELADGHGGFVLLASYDDPVRSRRPIFGGRFSRPLVFFVKWAPCAKTCRPRRWGKHCASPTREPSAAMHYSHEGSCHCGAIGIVLRSTRPPHDQVLGACQCGFCRKHNARAFSDPDASVTLVAHEPEHLQRYSFGASHR